MVSIWNCFRQFISNLIVLYLIILVAILSVYPTNSPRIIWGIIFVAMLAFSVLYVGSMKVIDIDGLCRVQHFPYLRVLFYCLASILVLVANSNEFLRGLGITGRQFALFWLILSTNGDLIYIIKMYFKLSRGMPR